MGTLSFFLDSHTHRVHISLKLKHPSRLNPNYFLAMVARTHCHGRDQQQGNDCQHDYRTLAFTSSHGPKILQITHYTLVVINCTTKIVIILVIENFVTSFFIFNSFICQQCFF